MSKTSNIIEKRRLRVEARNDKTEKAKAQAHGAKAGAAKPNQIKQTYEPNRQTQKAIRP